MSWTMLSILSAMAEGLATFANIIWPYLNSSGVPSLSFLYFGGLAATGGAEEALLEEDDEVCIDLEFESILTE